MTPVGRRRPIPELRASNRQTRSLGERLAVNSVMQGTAADLIKVAMIRVHSRLRAEGRAGRLVSQVHDELLLEVPETEVSAVKEVVRSEMIKRIGLDHLRPHDLLYRAHLGLRDLQQQLVVHLQHQTSGAALGPQPAVHTDHRHLDQIGSCSLHDRVDGEALAERARLPVGRAKLGDRAPATEQGGHEPIGARLGDRSRDERLDVREARQYVSM